MADSDSSQQIAIMKRMLELAEKQLQQSEYRTRLSEDRSRMSAERSRFSIDRSHLSEDRSRMSADRSRMSAERSEMSETRSYHNAERTLSVWIRTALSLMVLGIAMDRFGLLFHKVPGGRDYAVLHANKLLDIFSIGCGAALVLMGIFMALVTGLRFLAYARTWRRRHQLPPHHGPYLATFFALMTGLFGMVLLTLMLVFAS